MKKLLLLLALLPMMANAAECGITINGIHYIYNPENGEATVSGIIMSEFSRMYSQATTTAIKISEEISVPMPYQSPGRYVVTSIGDGAFSMEYKLPNYGCKRLTSITIPKSVTSIGKRAFSECSSLTSFTIPDGVTSIGEYAFQGCSSLKSVTIGKSVTSIGDYAFYGCSSLTSIKVRTGNAVYDSRDKCNAIIETNSNTLLFGCKSTTIPNSVTSIGNFAFYECSGLTSITIPNSVTSIGEYAFCGCSGLTSITIPNSVTSIGDYAFSGCSGLTSITIPNSVTSIGDYAFRGCSGLKEIISLIEEPWKIDDLFECWDDDNYVAYYPDATLYVPAGTKEKYETTAGWNVFKNIVVMGSYRLTYLVDGEEYESFEIEDGASITPLDEPTKEGFTFSGWSEIPEIMPSEDVTITGTFSVNSYKLTYSVDGKKYDSSEKEYGARITPLDEPTKEGYTFSGWSEIPETMPANDVTITGTFSINKYRLTYIVDREDYNSSEIEYGSSITPLEEPTKEGYSFSGWSEIPETMPANDVTVTGSFTKGVFKLTYIVNGKEYKTCELDYGASITPLDEPTMEGYTFSGWSGIPEIMPAEDITITGSFTINSYMLTYLVDGEEYESYVIEYGTSITPLEEPTKEGYSFSSWSEIPETMPAEDVTVTGTFTINSYKLTYLVDGEEYESYVIEYGTSITPLEEPTKEGYSFSSWSEIPETMPAEDVTVTGSFSVNSYKLTYMIDNEVYKETTYEYGSTIVPEPQPEGNYATFEWEDLPETMPAENIVIHANYTTGIIDVLLNSQRNVRIYTPDGKKRDQLQKGLNIVVLDDGTIHKIVTK